MNNIVELLEKLISFKSITPNDDGAMEFIEQYMDGFEAIRFDKNGVKNLFLYKKFGDGIHLNFAGHIDVVPEGEGWESSPFIATIKDGYIYGRGASDMKSGVCAMLNSCKMAKNFNGTLSIILTSDEEGDGIYGTLEVLKELQSRNFLPNFSIVAEPTCEKVFGDAIKVGRRGSINGVLELFGRQGHSAYPEKAINVIDKIAPILPQIAGVKLDNGDEFFAPTQIVITDIRAGIEVSNVSPGRLKMMFNVRNSNNSSLESVQNFIDEKFSGLDYKLTLKQGSKPFITNNNSTIVKNITKAIFEITNIEPKLSTAGGTSDARFFGEFGVDVVEFGVLNETIHAPNENVKIEDLKALEEVFIKVIELF